LGLAGQNIPLSGRIVALADFLDALTTVRPFRPAWLIDKAAAAIASDRGHRFDPALVRAFLAGLESLRRIKRHFDGDESFVSRAATPY
jgi:putative two-component system response regulator